LSRLPLLDCLDDFVFDNQMLAQCIHFGFRLGELSCPARYFPEASSINFRRIATYGLGVVQTSLQFRLKQWGWARAYLTTLRCGWAPTIPSSINFSWRNRRVLSTWSCSAFYPED
jgi:hypothetical protein